MEGDLNDDPPEQSGQLFVVSTPIGNMGDFSFRAVEVLKSVALILAEDTRHTRHLLDRYDIHTPTAAYHEHNEAKTAGALVRRLLSGADLAIVTDAGTPLLSDPGARLVAEAAAAGVPIVPIPGASALLAALVASAIPADRFTFYGFLPRKGPERAAALSEIVSLQHTAVIYEAPNRVAATLADLERLGAGTRATAVARELTKQHEEVRRGTVADLRAYYEGIPPRGEVVIVVAGGEPIVVSDDLVSQRAHALRAAGASVRDTAAALAAELGIPRNAAYRAARDAGE